MFSPQRPSISKTRRSKIILNVDDISVTGSFENASFANVTGRYPVINATALDTTDLSAVAAWHVLQGFLGGLTQLDSNITTVTSKEFNLWTER